MNDLKKGPEHDFREFLRFLKRHKFSKAQIAGEVPMPDELQELATRMGLERYELWAMQVLDRDLLPKPQSPETVQEIVNTLVYEYGPSFMSRPDRDAILEESGLSPELITDRIIERADAKARERLKESIASRSKASVVLEGDPETDSAASLGWGPARLDDKPERVMDRLDAAEDIERRLEEEKEREREKTKERLRKLKEEIEQLSREEGEVQLTKKKAKKKDRRKVNVGVGKQGSILVRTYKGKEYRVLVGKDGYVLDGIVYPSLTAVAEKITGRHISGPEFFKP